MSLLDADEGNKFLNILYFFSFRLEFLTFALKFKISRVFILFKIILLGNSMRRGQSVGFSKADRSIRRALVISFKPKHYYDNYTM